MDAIKRHEHNTRIIFAIWLVSSTLLVITGDRLFCLFNGVWGLFVAVTEHRLHARSVKENCKKQ